MECYCDFEQPEFYLRKTPKAVKEHECYECGSVIKPGEIYENVRAKWDGCVSTTKTCPDCLMIRRAFDEMECFCWSHGGLFEDIRRQMSEAHFPPGGRFFYLRMLAQHRKRLKSN